MSDFLRRRRRPLTGSSLDSLVTQGKEEEAKQNFRYLLQQARELVVNNAGARRCIRQMAEIASVFPSLIRDADQLLHFLSFHISDGQATEDICILCDAIATNNAEALLVPKGVLILKAVGHNIVKPDNQLYYYSKTLQKITQAALASTDAHGRKAVNQALKTEAGPMAQLLYLVPAVIPTLTPKVFDWTKGVTEDDAHLLAPFWTFLKLLTKLDKLLIYSLEGTLTDKPGLLIEAGIAVLEKANKFPNELVLSTATVISYSLIWSESIAKAAADKPLFNLFLDLLLEEAGDESIRDIGIPKDISSHEAFRSIKSIGTPTALESPEASGRVKIAGSPNAPAAIASPTAIATKAAPITTISPKAAGAVGLLLL